MAIKIPTALAERLVAPEAFHVLNDLLGPQLTADARQGNYALFENTLGSPDDDPSRYQAVASRYEDDHDAETLKNHVIDDLKGVNPGGWDGLNTAVSSAISDVGSDPGQSMLITLQLESQEPAGPDDVVIKTDKIGSVTLVRWIVGPAWIERLGVDNGSGGKFMEVPVLEGAFDALS